MFGWEAGGKQETANQAAADQDQYASVDANCQSSRILIGNLEKSFHSCLNCSCRQSPIKGVEKCASLLASWQFSVPLSPWPLLLLSRRPGKACVASAFHKMWTSPC